MDNDYIDSGYRSHLLQPVRDYLKRHEDHFKAGEFDVYEAGEKFRIQVGMFWVYFESVEDLNTILFGLTGKGMQEKEYKVLDEVIIKWNLNSFMAGERVVIINIYPSVIPLYLCQNKDGFIMSLTENDFK